MFENNKYFNKGHVTPLAFLLLESGGLSEKEKKEILYHITVCDDCMTLYVESLDCEFIVEPPKEMESKILSAVSNEKQKKRTRKTMAIQFVKLGIAVCITMVLFVGGIFDIVVEAPNKMIKYAQSVQEQSNQQPVKPKEEEIKENKPSLADNLNDAFISFADFFNNPQRPEKTN